VIWPNNTANSVLLTQLFDQMPQCTQDMRMVAGFPEYEVRTDKLDGPQRGVIGDIARDIVRRSNTMTPIVAVLVVGHADQALRKPQVEREQFELDVSKKRAEAATTALLDEINRMKAGGDATVLSRLKTVARGMGSSRRLVQNPKTESEMRMNRRVEIYWATCFVPDPGGLKERIERAQKLLATRRVVPDSTGTRTERVRCLLKKMLNPKVVDVFVDGTASNEQIGKFFVGEPLCGWAGNYDPPPISETDFLKFLATVSPILKGPGFSLQQSDDRVLEILGGIALRIDLGIERVDAYIMKNGLMATDPLFVGPLLTVLAGVRKNGYAGDETRIRLKQIYRNHIDEEDNIYSCWK
jgi:hypothetical protein